MDVILTLITVALLLFFLEIFLPGGIVAAVAVLLMLIASVLMALDYGLWSGIWLFLGTGCAAVALFFVEIYILKYTPVGKIISLNKKVEGSCNAPSETTDLAGLRGRTVTPLNPGGRVLIQGQLYEASLGNGYLATDQPIEVRRQEPFRLLVKAVSEEQTVPEAPATQEPAS